jgi:D-serine deaminase-like pyridoxal phosphate-dependent protein
MLSRRNLLATSAALVAGGSSSFGDTPNRFAEMDARIARHDLKDIYKEDLPTPCMIVDQEIFDANLRKMATHCRATGIHLRGPGKVHKSVEIARRQIALGGIGVTCATVAECELMSSAGIGNIPDAAAHQQKQHRTRHHAGKTRQTFGTVVDDPLATDWLQAAAAQQSLKLRTADVYAGLTLCASFWDKSS